MDDSDLHKLSENITESAICTMIIEALNRYADEGIPCGRFLRVILENVTALENNLNKLGCPDVLNWKLIEFSLQYVHHQLPSEIWGSPEKVDAHLLAMKNKN